MDTLHPSHCSRVHDIDVDTRTPSMDVLRELVDSRYTVYDVLPTFWNYTGQEIIHGGFVPCPLA